MLPEWWEVKYMNYEAETREPVWLYTQVVATSFEDAYEKTKHLGVEVVVRGRVISERE